MKPVAPTPEELRKRRARDLDRLDEVWEGEYHVVPAPDWEHQELSGNLLVFLLVHVTRHHLGRVNHDVNVRVPGSAESDYRVPDLVFVSEARKAIVGGKWVEGGPDVVFEIRSPGDETYEKVGFYGAVGVSWLVILNGKESWLEVYRFVGGRGERVPCGAGGAVHVPPLGVSLRVAGRREVGRPRLKIASTLGDGASGLL
jgi:Uma2 family endonuclease